MGLFTGIFGANAYSNRELKRIEPIKNKVLALDEEYSELSDAELVGYRAQAMQALPDGLVTSVRALDISIRDAAGGKFEDDNDIKILGTPYIPEEYKGKCIICGKETDTPAYAARTM